MGRRSRSVLASFAIASALASALLGVSCVDGVTPDCSTPGTCGPADLDAGQETSVVVVPEASVDADPLDDADIAEAGDAADGG